LADVFWIKGRPAAKLAIVARPRGGAWLEQDMCALRKAGLQTLVSLLEKDEAEWLGLDNELQFAERLEMTFLSFPIPDMHVPPDTDRFREFVTGIAERLRSGEQIGVHCRGSIGRSTLIAACALMHLGWLPRVALKAIEKARGCAVPNTEEQERWILRYRAE
jgi:protein-tyrosine phosphatase